MDEIENKMDRLYELYVEHFGQLRAEVIEANRSLGSTRPEKTWMELLSRIDFERMITIPSEEPEMLQRWLKRLTRGHEHEFPELWGEKVGG